MSLAPSSHSKLRSSCHLDKSPPLSWCEKIVCTCLVTILHMCYLRCDHSPYVLLALWPLAICVTCFVTIPHMCYLPCDHSLYVFPALWPFPICVTCFVTIRQMCYLPCYHSSMCYLPCYHSPDVLLFLKDTARTVFSFQSSSAIKITFFCIELTP
jgi:hypothetical protein